MNKYQFEQIAIRGRVMAVCLDEGGNEVVTVWTIGENVAAALKEWKKVVVSFGDKAMVYAGNLRELCLLYKDCRFEFMVERGRVGFKVEDWVGKSFGRITNQGSFRGWEMGKTLFYRGKKVKAETILVVSWDSGEGNKVQ